MTVHHVSRYLAMGGPKENAKFQKRAKKSQKLKINQKFILHFSEASWHVPWCFIPQKNSRASLITWLKGYSVIFTYDREISKRSWGGNRGTPCRIKNPPIVYSQFQQPDDKFVAIIQVFLPSLRKA